MSREEIENEIHWVRESLETFIKYHDEDIKEQININFITAHGVIDSKESEYDKQSFVVSTDGDLELVIEDMFSFVLSGIQKLPVEKQTRIIKVIENELSRRAIRMNMN